MSTRRHVAETLLGNLGVKVGVLCAIAVIGTVVPFVWRRWRFNRSEAAKYADVHVPTVADLRAADSVAEARDEPTPPHADPRSA